MVLTILSKSKLLYIKKIPSLENSQGIIEPLPGWTPPKGRCGKHPLFSKKKIRKEQNRIEHPEKSKGSDRGLSYNILLVLADISKI